MSRLPLALLPRVVSMAYAPCLLVFTIGMSVLLRAATRRLRTWVNDLDPFAFFVLTNYWLRVAWRAAPESPRS